jgi:hypothetical protein
VVVVDGIWEIVERAEPTHSPDPQQAPSEPDLWVIKNTTPSSPVFMEFWDHGKQLWTSQAHAPKWRNPDSTLVLPEGGAWVRFDRGAV